MNLANLNSFLQLGYFLDYENPTYRLSIDGVLSSRLSGMNEQELIEQGIKIFRNAISYNYNAKDSHVVPISGGLDSRALLAGILEHTEASKIFTYTFGSPGSYDYEIGNMIAKKIGTNHQSINLTEIEYSQNELEIFSNRSDQQTILFYHAPINILDSLHEDKKVWSGYMGDPLAGSHLYKEPSKNFEAAKKRFIEKNTIVHSIQLTNADFSHLIDIPNIKSDILSYDEQLDFYNRQIKYIAPHVLVRGFDYVVPFLSQDFVDFMINIPNKYRYDEYLYKKLLLQAFPSLFRLSTKTNYGLALDASKLALRCGKLRHAMWQNLGYNKNINYVDFKLLFDKNQKFQYLIQKNMSDLKKRGIIDWLDISQIFDAHVSGKVNHIDALLVLTSLEIHLKVGKSI